MRVKGSLLAIPPHFFELFLLFTKRGKIAINLVMNKSEEGTEGNIFFCETVNSNEGNKYSLSDFENIARKKRSFSSDELWDSISFFLKGDGFNLVFFEFFFLFK